MKHDKIAEHEIIHVLREAGKPICVDEIIVRIFLQRYGHSNKNAERMGVLLLDFERSVRRQVTQNIIEKIDQGSLLSDYEHNVYLPERPASL